jgi:hypothetical protein
MRSVPPDLPILKPRCPPRRGFVCSEQIFLTIKRLNIKNNKPPMPKAKRLIYGKLINAFLVNPTVVRSNHLRSSIALPRLLGIWVMGE